MRSFAFFSLAAALALAPSVAFAETYQVGPDQKYKDLSSFEDSLKPGDIVEVEGGQVYPGEIHIKDSSSGTPDQKVTLRGIPVNGKRPVISGGADYGIVLNASHFVFESFEVTASPTFCVVHKADDVTIRDVIIHDCPQDGLLGTDSESGSLTMEYSEVFNCGSGDHYHQIYMATDETMYPGSVFRLQHCYIHDGLGGNSVKSRSERNEIYYNWIEESDAGYHVLDLIGPDGQDEGLAREDSDVVGNVLIQHGSWYISRMGGDGTGETGGRYRFAFNTMILDPQARVFAAQDSIESLEVDNNVLFTTGGSMAQVLNDEDAAWVTGSRVVSGSNNFVDTAIMPDFLGKSVSGADPQFTDAKSEQFVPLATSPLVDAADAAAKGPSGHEIPNPLGEPVFLPPSRALDAGMMAASRSTTGKADDIGAFEFGNVPNPGAGEGGYYATPTTSAGAGGDDGGTDSSSGCSCSTTGTQNSGLALLASSALLVVAASRRRREIR